MTDRQKIDAMHEGRMWIQNIVVPIITTFGLMMTDKEIRDHVVAVCKNTADRVKVKIKTILGK